jgi:hypothetical protein
MAAPTPPCGTPPEPSDQVEQHIHPALNREEWYALATWLDAIPAELLQARPQLLLAHARIMNAAVPQKAIATLEDARAP